MYITRLLKIIGICLLCGTLSAPQFDVAAEGRRHGGNSHGNHSSRPNNDHKNNHNGGKHGNRPGKHGGNHNSRPGHGGDKNHNPRPGNHGGNHNHNPRPGNHGGNYNPRPGHGGGNHYNPRPNLGHHKPNHGHHKPAPGHHHRPVPPRPPHRPHRPHRFWHHHPAPPMAFRPHHHITPLQAIVGVAIGTAFNVSLNYLYANNYVVDGYDNNSLYLRNVNAYNCMWPDAVLSYSNGRLATGNFTYSTSYYDRGRFNTVYNILSNSYGPPVSSSSSNNGWSSTWWGYDNRYITLDYRPYYAADGSLRYYTTLMVG